MSSLKKPTSTLTKRRASSRSRKAREKKKEEDFNKLFEEVMSRIKSGDTNKSLYEKVFSFVTGLSLNILYEIPKLPKTIVSCDGVGSGYGDGTVYKILAVGFLGVLVWGLKYLLTLLTPFANNAVSKLNKEVIPVDKQLQLYAKYAVNTKEDFEKLLVETCKTKMNTIQDALETIWKTVMLDESGIQKCKEMKNLKSEMTNLKSKMENEAEFQAKRYFLSMYRDLIEWLPLNFIEGKPRLWIKSLLAGLGILKVVNMLVCKLAAKIEVMFKSAYSACTFKQKQDLIKTLSSELRLFDSGIKF